MGEQKPAGKPPQMNLEKAREEFLKEPERRKTAQPAAPAQEKADSGKSSPEADAAGMGYSAWLNAFFPPGVAETMRRMYASAPIFNPFQAADFYTRAFAGLFPWTTAGRDQEAKPAENLSGEQSAQLLVLMNVLEMILQEMGLFELEKHALAGREMDETKKRDLALLAQFRKAKAIAEKSTR